MIYRPGISSVPIRSVHAARPFSLWVRHDASPIGMGLSRFEHPDRVGYLSVPNRAFLADVGQVSRHAVHSSKPRLTSSSLARRSHWKPASGPESQTR